MNMLKNKKVLFSIIFVTILVIISSYIVTNLQNKEYQKQVNVVIANILGKIKQSYPETNEEEILKILNTDSLNIELGSEILEKYNIEIDEVSAIKSLENEKNILTNNIIIISFAILILIIFGIF